MGDYRLSSMATYHEIIAYAMSKRPERRLRLTITGTSVTEVSVFGDNERPTNLKDAPMASQAGKAAAHSAGAISSRSDGCYPPTLWIKSLPSQSLVPGQYVPNATIPRRPRLQRSVDPGPERPGAGAPAPRHVHAYRQPTAHRAGGDRQLFRRSSGRLRYADRRDDAQGRSGHGRRRRPGHSRGAASGGGT